MSRNELFKAVLSDMIEKIQKDAIYCLDNPPEQNIHTYSEEDLKEKVIEYHTKGEVGVYLYFLTLLEVKKYNTDLKKEAEVKKDDAKSTDT